MTFVSGFYWLVSCQQKEIIRITPATGEKKVYALDINGYEAGKSLRGVLNGRFMLVTDNLRQLKILKIDANFDISLCLAKTFKSQVWTICPFGAKSEYFAVLCSDPNVIYLYQIKPKRCKTGVHMDKIIEIDEPEFIRTCKRGWENTPRGSRLPFTAGALATCPQSEVLISHGHSNKQGLGGYFMIYRLSSSLKKVVWRKYVDLENLKVKKYFSIKSLGYFNNRKDLMFGGFSDNYTDRVCNVFSFDVVNREFKVLRSFPVACGQVYKPIESKRGVIGIGRKGRFVNLSVTECGDEEDLKSGVGAGNEAGL